MGLEGLLRSARIGFLTAVIALGCRYASAQQSIVSVKHDANGDGFVKNADAIIYLQQDNNGSAFEALRKALGLEQSYAVEYAVTTDTVEYRLWLGGQHFLSVLNQNGIFALRPHPGGEREWGSTPYLQPYISGISGAKLQYSVINSITADENGVQVNASGRVSKNDNDSFGTWTATLSFSYDPAIRKVVGSGSYSIKLDGRLSENDLTVALIASNRLEDANSGDMQQADYAGNGFSGVWIPDTETKPQEGNVFRQPSHYPQDITDMLSVKVAGEYNVYDAAQKPTVTMTLTSRKQGIPMIFGGEYTVDESNNPSADNVGVLFVILKTTADTEFEFDVEYEAAQN